MMRVSYNVDVSVEQVSAHNWKALAEMQGPTASALRYGPDAEIARRRAVGAALVEFGRLLSGEDLPEAPLGPKFTACIAHGCGDEDLGDLDQETGLCGMCLRSAVEVAAGVHSDGSGRVLICQREHKDFNGCWEYPGGKREPGESLRDALVREISEELEAKVQVEQSPFFRGVFHDTQDRPFLLSAFLMHKPVGHFRLGPVHSSLTWKSLEDVLALPDDQVTPSLKAITAALFLLRELPGDRHAV